MSVWKSDEKLLSICILNFSFKMILFEKKYQTGFSKFVKNTPLRVVFSTLFSVFHLVMKHCVSCLIYYMKHDFLDQENDFFFIQQVTLQVHAM